MPELSKIKIGNTYYDIKDKVARNNSSGANIAIPALNLPEDICVSSFTVTTNENASQITFNNNDPITLTTGQEVTLYEDTVNNITLKVKRQFIIGTQYMAYLRTYPQGSTAILAPDNQNKGGDTYNMNSHAHTEKLYLVRPDVINGTYAFFKNIGNNPNYVTNQYYTYVNVGTGVTGTSTLRTDSMLLWRDLKEDAVKETDTGKTYKDPVIDSLRTCKVNLKETTIDYADQNNVYTRTGSLHPCELYLNDSLDTTYEKPSISAYDENYIRTEWASCSEEEWEEFDPDEKAAYLNYAGICLGNESIKTTILGNTDRPYYWRGIDSEESPKEIALKADLDYNNLTNKPIDERDLLAGTTKHVIVTLDSTNETATLSVDGAGVNGIQVNSYGTWDNFTLYLYADADGLYYDLKIMGTCAYRTTTARAIKWCNPLDLMIEGAREGFEGDIVRVELTRDTIYRHSGASKTCDLHLHHGGLYLYTVNDQLENLRPTLDDMKEAVNAVVYPNPDQDATETLSKLLIDDKVYSIGGMTEAAIASYIDSYMALHYPGVTKQ